VEKSGGNLAHTPRARRSAPSRTIPTPPQPASIATDAREIFPWYSADYRRGRGAPGRSSLTRGGLWGARWGGEWGTPWGTVGSAAGGTQPKKFN